MSKHAKPFETDYAKTSRAKCKGCKDVILQGTLRLAIMVQSPFFDGKTPKWYHEACFWTKHRPSAFNDIHNVTSLKHQDQEKIKSMILGSDTTDAPDSKSSGKGKSKKRTKKDKEIENAKCVNKLNDFSIEYAKSNRAVCRGCEAKIAKGEVRASKKSYESDQAKMIGGIPEWYHLSCFVSVRFDLEFLESGKLIPGFSSLNPADKKNVEKVLPSVANSDTKDSDGPGPSKKARVALDEFSPQYKAQNEKLTEALEHAKKMKKAELSSLLEVNGIAVPRKTGDIQALVADHLVCGKLVACPKCKGEGKYVLVPDEGYQCLNSQSELKLKSVGAIPCHNIMRDVERSEFLIPDEMKDKYDFLNQYGSFEKRIYAKVEPVAGPSTLSVKSELKSGPKVERFLPLKDMVFYLHASAASSKTSKQTLTKNIINLGGDVTSTLKPHVVAAIATKNAIETMEEGEGGKDARIMEELKEMDVHVVPAKFVKEAANGKAQELIEKLNLAPWGSDLNSRIALAKDEKLKSQQKSMSGKSKSGKVKLTVKDGHAVDPESGLADTADLVKYEGRYLNATMSKTDLATGKNSFYKLQVLQSKIHKSKYYVFRAWGRIGTTIGGTKLTDYKNLHEALDEFEKMFEEKSGNDWNCTPYVTMPDKMAVLDVKYDTPNVPVDTSNLECPLAQPVKELVELLFDEKAMLATLAEYELDMEKMPLGKLSSQQIKSGYQILEEIINVIKGHLETGKDDNNNVLITLSNTFYTTIPHTFGLGNPPVLGDSDLVTQKIQMLDAMAKIDEAYSIKQEGCVEGMHPVLGYYEQLKADIIPVDTNHPHYDHIVKYVRNTHAKTHRSYELHIQDIFQVSREGEEKRFKPMAKLGNKQLLWHGSRLTNFASIISKGLCIAPPEAPATGYMFGKGIYFADSVSKSANYCMTNSTNNVGLLLLCEVALGNVLPKTQAEYVTKLPFGHHSVQGVGRSFPEPAESIVLDDNVTVPLGTLKDKTREEAKDLSLLYNEFIVYDPAQVKIRYILKVRFDYK